MPDVPLWPSLVAVIVAVPAAMPLTSPLLLTVATLALLLAQVTGRPVKVPPAESFSVAVNCAVCPTCKLPEDGETATEATGTDVTVIAAVLLWPSLVAVIVAEPAATPVIRPLGLTRATVVSPLPHVTVRPVNVLPVESFRVAVSCTVCPTRMLAVGETVTEATAVGVLGPVGASPPTTGTETPTTRLATAAASASSMRPFGLCASAGVTPGRQVVVGSQGGMPVAAAPPFTGRTLARKKASAVSVVVPADARPRSSTSHTLISPSRLASPNR